MKAIFKKSLMILIFVITISFLIHFTDYYIYPIIKRPEREYITESIFDGNRIMFKTYPAPN